MKQATDDAFKSWFNVGEYKRLENFIDEQTTSKPENVSENIRELLTKYNKKTKKTIEDELIELKKNLINYPVEIKILNTNTATTAIHEVNLIDFKCKKVIKTTSIAELNNKIQKFLQEEGKKLEEKGLLPKPTPPIFYINYAKKTLTMNFYYEK